MLILWRAEGHRARSIATSLRPVITDGHLAMARAVGAGEYRVALNNYVNLIHEREARRQSDRCVAA